MISISMKLKYFKDILFSLNYKTKVNCIFELAILYTFQTIFYINFYLFGNLF